MFTEKDKTEAKVQSLMLKGAVSEMSEEDRVKISQCVAELITVGERLIEKYDNDIYLISMSLYSYNLIEEN